MVILAAVFLILFTGWMLWAWLIAESRDFRMMKLWCARGFIALAAVVCLGAGAWFRGRNEGEAHRATMTRFIQLLDERAKSGRLDDVRDALQHVADEPDEWSLHSPDILVRVQEVTEALEKSRQTAIAERDQESSERL